MPTWKLVVRRALLLLLSVLRLQWCSGWEHLKRTPTIFEKPMWFREGKSLGHFV